MLALRHDKRAGASALAPLLAPRNPGKPGKLWLDRRSRVSLDHSVPQIGAPAAYARGLDGTGVKIAVLDTGIDESHPDLAGKVIDKIDLVGDGSADGADLLGHGTHVASIIAGSGAASAGSYHGVAPGARLLNARVCDEYGGCAFSAILAGMEWAVAHGATIVNLSLGAEDSAEIDPMEEAINTLSAAHGTLFVAAAGNFGGELRTVDSPSTADAALSVGAVDRGDVRASFSGQGPRRGDNALKPEVTAPGVAIVAARAANTQLGDPVGASYVALSGTSMATPHVAGAAALLAQQHPSWTGQQLKAALMGSAAPQAATTAFQQGAGRVDVARAVAQPIYAKPSTLNLGIAAFPHHDDEPLVATVRYSNDSATAVTLTFQAQLITLTGVAAPADLVSFSPATAALAPGAAMNVVVSLDPRLATADGVYGGQILASSASNSSGGSSDAARVVTPISFTREAEAYDLKVFVRGLDGQPSSALLNVMAAEQPGTPARDASVSYAYVTDHETFHLPVGTYLVSSLDYEDNTFVLAPRVTISRDSALLMDGQLTRPTKLTLFDASRAPVGAGLSIYDTKSDFETLTGTLQGAPLAMTQLGPSAPPDEVFWMIRSSFPDAQRPDHGYYVARAESTALPTGWTRHFRERDFARVEGTYAASEGHLLQKSVFATPPRFRSLIGQGWESDRPAHHTDFYYGRGVGWFSQLWDFVEDPEFPGYYQALWVMHSLRDYLSGRTYQESWNRAPFGAAFASENLANPARTSDAPLRTGAQLRLATSRFSDAQFPAAASRVLSQSTSLKLFRNGELFASAPPDRLEILATLPTTLAQYRLELASDQLAPFFESSTKVTAAWTFQTRAAAGSEILPLPTVRFAPPLDDHNRATSAATLLPIFVERPVGSARPAIAELDVELSFDDGATWKKLPIARLGDRALGLVLHPPGATHVSLRGKTRDAAGNRSEHTILRAYLIERR